jgi:hypothetical protein
VEGIVEPVGLRLQARLRRAVWELARTENRRGFPPVMHAGDPGGAVAALEIRHDARQSDYALRVDVVSALVRRTRPRVDTPLVWLTRPGPLADTQDVDLEWLAATRAAAAELATHLPFVVVNRRAWRDPRSGVGRVWKRPRPNRRD